MPIGYAAISTIGIIFSHCYPQLLSSRVLSESVLVCDGVRFVSSPTGGSTCAKRPKHFTIFP